MTFPTHNSAGVLYGGLPMNEAQQQLSVAYAQTISAGAGCSLDILGVDHEGVDVQINSQQMDHYFAFPVVKIQLKCTFQSDLIKTDHIAWSLKRKNYDQLRLLTQPPRLLVVMHCPADVSGWLAHSTDSLAMAHGAYWVNLLDEPEITGDGKSKTVHVPLAQHFTVDALLGIMERAGKGHRL